MTRSALFIELKLIFYYQDTLFIIKLYPVWYQSYNIAVIYYGDFVKAHKQKQENKKWCDNTTSVLTGVILTLSHDLKMV